MALIRSGGKNYNEWGYSLRHRSGVDDFFEYNAACDELVKRNLIWWNPDTDGYELVTITRDIERERYLQAGHRPGIRFDFKYMAQRGLSFDEALAWMKENGYEALKRSLIRNILTEEIWLRFVDALVEEENIKEWFTKK